jgi:hypothetical protein
MKTKIKMWLGKKALLTCDNFFVAPDGKQYRSVHGVVRGVFTSEETLGIKTNARSSNWYVMIGNMIIAGCQIHYAVRCEEVNSMDVEEQTWSAEGGLKTFLRKTVIYNA